MTVLTLSLVGVLGAILGSFYNVVGIRIPLKQSIVRPRSHCSNCKERVREMDLIPVISYIFLHGKCRNCGIRISPLYMAVELTTALLFMLAYDRIGLQWELLVALLFISLLVIIVVSDIRYMIIPNKILLVFLMLLVPARLLAPLPLWWDSVVGAFLGFGLLLLIAIFSKGGMGGGDMKLFFVIGFVLGTVPTILTLFLASIIGILLGIPYLWNKEKGKQMVIPFGPAIAVAAVIIYFYGASILQLYSSII